MFKLGVLFLISFLSQNALNISSNIVIKKEEVPKVLMTLDIPSINFTGNIYDKKSKLNDIDKNIIILNDSDLPSDKNGIVLIGGHSGIGKYAYFKNLNKVKIGDKLIITYDNIKYYYEVNNYYLEKKDGNIRINNFNNINKLILYTCNPNDKKNYLVIVSSFIKKE